MCVCVSVYKYFVIWDDPERAPSTGSGVHLMLEPW